MWVQGKASADGWQAGMGRWQGLFKQDYLTPPSETAAAGRLCSPTLGKGPEDLIW